MPELDKHQPVLYGPLHPYHWETDNLPLQSLIERDRVINDAVDIAGATLRDAKGTQLDLASRLNRSLDSAGSVKAASLDDAEHSIGAHSDGEWDGVEYVRMLKDERDKLALIADEATSLVIEIQTISTTVEIDDGPVVFKASDTVSWRVTNSNEVQADLVYPPESVHRHYYDMEPVTEDYLNFQVTSTSTPFIENSLRVYINGVRLSDSTSIFVPGNLSSDNWTLMSFNAEPEEGTFTLSSAITEDDVIRVDFDVSLL